MQSYPLKGTLYPASIVGSVWPVPTWNLHTVRQSVQTAGKLPAELSASIRVGATLVAMMGDQSQSTRGKGGYIEALSLQTRRRWRTHCG